MTNAPLCQRCGMRKWSTDDPMLHYTCDESRSPEETWLTDDERREREERIRAYERRKRPETATVESLLEQIQQTSAIIGKGIVS